MPAFPRRRGLVPAPPEYNEISQSRFETFVRRLFNLKGAGVLERVGRGALPVIPLVGPMMMDERFQKGYLQYSVFVNLAAPGAGNNNFFRLNNPVGSGVLVGIETVRYNGSTAGVIALGIDTPTATAQDVGALDGRVLPRAGGTYNIRGAAQLHTGNTVGAAPIAQPIAGSRNSTAFIWPITFQAHGIILVPGQGLILNNSASNQAESLELCWWERQIDRAELS